MTRLDPVNVRRRETLEHVLVVRADLLHYKGPCGVHAVLELGHHTQEFAHERRCGRNGILQPHTHALDFEPRVFESLEAHDARTLRVGHFSRMQHASGSAPSADIYATMDTLTRKRCELDILYKLMFSDDNAVLFSFTDGLIRGPSADMSTGVIYQAHLSQGMLPSVQDHLERLQADIRAVWTTPHHPMTQAVRTVCQVLVLVSLLTQPDFLGFMAGMSQSVDCLNVYRDEDLAPRTAGLVSKDMLTMGQTSSEHFLEEYVHECTFAYAMRCFPDVDAAPVPKRSALPELAI